MSAPHPAANPPSLQMLCPHLTCRKVLSVTVAARGQVVRCQHCQNLLRVPATPSAAPAKPAASDVAA